MSDQMYFERNPSFYATYLNKFRNTDGPLLDMGTGHGLLMQLAVERGIESYGVECNHKRVKICCEKGLNVIEHNLCTPLPFADSTFGMVYCGQVIEHVPPDGQLMIVREALRVLSPGGVFQIRSPNRNFEQSRMSKGHDYLLTIRELADMLSRAGFVKIDLSMNYPQDVPELPKFVLMILWRLYRPDLLASTASAICFKRNSSYSRLT